MRLIRIGFVLLAVYLVFLGGGAYYGLILPVRIGHHLLLTLLLSIWLITRLRRRQGLPHTPLNLPIYAAVIVWIVSAAASIDPRMAWEHLWLQLIHVLFFFALAALFQEGWGRRVLETQFLLAGVVVFLSGLELASWYFGLGLLPETSLGWVDVVGPGAWVPLAPRRLSLAMNISTLLAGYTAPLVTLAAAWALTAARPYRPALWALAAALLAVLLLTFSRGGILSLASAGGVLAVLRLSQAARGMNAALGRWLLGLAAVGGIALVALYLVFGLTAAGGRGFGDEGRLDMWRSALRMAQDDPLTGVGPGLFGRAYRSLRDPDLAQDKLASAHNAYLNTAAETGLPGLAVSLWLALALLRAWAKHRQNNSSTSLNWRLDAALAALIGIGVHSLVDVFTTTPLVLLTLLLAVYIACSGAAAPGLPRWLLRLDRAAGALALAAVVGYGLWWIRLDQAQILYERSFQHAETALEDARQAAVLDPDLNLYDLQVAYLTGLYAPSAEAAAAYRQALQLEPTWDVGWINLAALYWQQGNVDEALNALDTARNINRLNTASLHWARLAEAERAAPQPALIEAFATALQWSPFLPLSDFWWRTEARQAALERYLNDADIAADWRYRVWSVHAPERAQALALAQPQTGPEWWVAGAYALEVEGDVDQAVECFTQAIQLNPNVGDYYAARGRAVRLVDEESARRDLQLALLLGTFAEYPKAVLAEMTADPEEAYRLRAAALPSRVTLQEFSAVLYGRPAQFSLPPELGPVGPGRQAMQPWYAVAFDRAGRGDREGAVRAYRAILEYAPDEAEARRILREWGYEALNWAGW